MQGLKQHIFHYNRPQDSKVRLISAGICILIINLVGFLSGNYSINAVASFGVFTFLHYTPTEDDRIIKRLMFVGLILFISYVLGLLSTVYILMGPLIIGLIAFVSRLLFRLFKLDKPGDLFIILCVAAGASNPVQSEEVAQLSLYFLSGVTLSILMGYLSLKIEQTPKQSTSFQLNLLERIRQGPRSIIDSFSFRLLYLLLVTLISRSA